MPTPFQTELDTPGAGTDSELKKEKLKEEVKKNDK